MACSYDPQLAGNALDNLNEIFKVNGEKQMMDFIHEADKHLDSLDESQLKEVKLEMVKFSNWLANNLGKAKPKAKTLKRKRSKGGAKKLHGDIFSLGGAWQPPMPPGGPYGPPWQPPLPPGPPPQMPRGPEGAGVVRGLIRVGMTFLAPRTTTGLIYAGLWLAIVLLAGNAEQQHHEFFMLGIEQITSGACMGTSGFFEIARHPICTKWRELWIPTLTALNEVTKFNLKAMGALTAGLSVVVAVPLLVDATVYEVAYNVDYVLTTALQSFTGRPLIPPTRSGTRPSLPQLMGRFIALVNPVQMGALTAGQQPYMGMSLAPEQYMPQGYAPPVYTAQASFIPQATFAPQAQILPQPYIQQPYAQPGSQLPYAQPYAQPYPRPVYAQPNYTQPQRQWDPRMAQEMPGPNNYLRRRPVSGRSISPMSHGSTQRNDDNRSRNSRSSRRSRGRSRSRSRRNYNRGENYY